jgi:hypothetical protein
LISRPLRAILGLATLVAGCTSLPPSKPIESTASLAGTWRGRMSGPAGSAPVIVTIQDDGSYHGILYVEPTYREIGGAISMIGPGRARYEGSDGTGTVTLHADGDTRVLRFVRDGGGGGAKLTPAR